MQTRIVGVCHHSSDRRTVGHQFGNGPFDVGSYDHEILEFGIRGDVGLKVGPSEHVISLESQIER